MAYNKYQKIGWKDHIVEYPNRYIETDNGDGTVTHVKDEGNVVQEGTPFSASNLERMDQGIYDAHDQLTEQTKKDGVFKNGPQLVTTTAPTALNITYEGRTLFNVIPNGAGGFDDTGSTQQEVTISKGWTASFWGTAGGGLDDRYVKYGRTSQKLHATSYSNMRRNFKIDNTKLYIALIAVRGDGAGSGQMKIETADGAYVKASAQSHGSQYWQETYALFKGSDFSTNDMMVKLYQHSSGAVWFDGLRIFEISQAEYDAISAGLYSQDELGAKYPYVERVVPTRNPATVVVGKNIFPTPNSFFLESDTENGWLVGTGNKHTVRGLKPGQQLTLSFLSKPTPNSTEGASFIIYYQDKNGNEIKYDLLYTPLTAGESFNEKTFTTPENCYAVALYGYALSHTRSRYFKNIQLEFGDTATAYTPYDEDVEYVIADLYDGEYIKEVDGNRVKHKKAEHTIMDGSRALNNTDAADTIVAGYRAFYFLNSSFDAIKTSTAIGKIVIDHTGRKLVGTTDATPTSVDYDYYVGGSWFRFLVSNDLTGFTDTLAITSNMWKGYLNGWKYTGDGTTHTWASLVDGAAAPTQTEAYVADPANMPSGFYPMEMVYEIDYTFDEFVKGEFGLSLQEGSNIVELTQSVVVEEVVTPTLTSGNEYAVIGEEYVWSSPDNPMDHVPTKYLTVFKNGQPDPSWTSATSAYISFEWMKTDGELYDPTAKYTVTYIANHIKGGSPRADFVYNTSLKSTVSEATNDIADLQRQNGLQDLQIYKLLTAAKANGWTV